MYKMLPKDFFCELFTCKEKCPVSVLVKWKTTLFGPFSGSSYQAGTSGELNQDIILKTCANKIF